MEFEQRPWQGALALFELNGLGQNLVHRFKFYNSPEMARPFAVLGSELLNNTNWSLDAIVPVPLHWTRCFVRGYNQAALYCEELARRTGVKYLPALSRIKRTRQQAKLGRDERRKNLKGAFSVKKTADIAGKSVLLIDDVMTTGATLTAAAETLLDGGALSVYIMVIGRR
jgi:ComF family protein